MKENNIDRLIKDLIFAAKILFFRINRRIEKREEKWNFTSKNNCISSLLKEGFTREMRGRQEDFCA